MKPLVFLPLALLMFAACHKPTTEEKIKEALTKAVNGEMKKRGVTVDALVIDSINYVLTSKFLYYTKTADNIEAKVDEFTTMRDAAELTRDTARANQYQRVITMALTYKHFLDSLAKAAPNTNNTYKVDYHLAFKTSQRSGDNHAVVFMDQATLLPLEENLDSMFRASRR